MGPDSLRRRLAESGAFWFAVSIVCSLAGLSLSVRTLVRYTDPPSGGYWFVLAGLALIFVAGYACARGASSGV